ncbi:MAG: hypothetical protein KIT48_14925 [Pseudolabrys sp.]|nr:hypothetical protein [Pseudolabrys sp.]
MIAALASGRRTVRPQAVAVEPFARNGVFQQTMEDRTMGKAPKDIERLTEDDRARAELGPQGNPGKPDQRKMTPDAEEQTPKSGEFDGHTA